MLPRIGIPLNGLFFLIVTPGIFFPFPVFLPLPLPVFLPIPIVSPQFPYTGGGSMEIFLLIVEDKHLNKDLVVEEVVFYQLEDLYQTFWKQVRLLLEFLSKQVHSKKPPSICFLVGLITTLPPFCIDLLI